MWGVPEEKRLLPGHQSGARLPLDIESDLADRLPVAARTALPKISQGLYEGMVRQVTSMPLDLRVERTIAATLPNHQEAQRAYLQQQVDDFLALFDPRIERCIPTSLYRASSAMNATFARAVAELVDTPVPRGIEESTFYHLSEGLLAHLNQEEDTYSGDRKATDGWATELGLSTWFSWRTLPTSSQPSPS